MTEYEGFNLVSRTLSFKYAYRGIKVMLSSQHNAWIHACVTFLVIVCAFLLKINALEWCAIVIAIAAVWCAEALNTSIEILCDVASAEFHPLIEKSKDVAAGAVLITALAAAVVGIIIFGPKLIFALGFL